MIVLMTKVWHAYPSRFSGHTSVARREITNFETYVRFGITSTPRYGGFGGFFLDRAFISTPHLLASVNHVEAPFLMYLF